MQTHSTVQYSTREGFAPAPPKYAARSLLLISPDPVLCCPVLYGPTSVLAALCQTWAPTENTLTERNKTMKSSEFVQSAMPGLPRLCSAHPCSARPQLPTVLELARRFYAVRMSMPRPKITEPPEIEKRCVDAESFL